MSAFVYSKEPGLKRFLCGALYNGILVKVVLRFCHQLAEARGAETVQVAFVAQVCVSCLDVLP